MNARITAAALLGTMLTMVTAAHAAAVQEALSPAQYFDCQIAAREATVAGLQERIANKQQVSMTQPEKAAAADLARGRVSLAMSQCGQQNAATLGAYAHRNADVLQTWLVANPQVQARLDALARRIGTLSTQMPAAPSGSTAPPAKR